MNKLLKTGLIIAGTVIGLMLLVLALSPVVKYVVNHYGKSLIGREMAVERVLINPFTGTVNIQDFHMREANDQTDFVAFGELDVRLYYPALMARRVSVGHIYLTDLTAQVLNGDTCFNFSDLITRFSSPEDTTAVQDTTESKWAFALRDIALRNGHLVYRDVPRSHQWAIENINLHVPGLYFGHQQSNAGLGFDLPTGGSVHLSAGYIMALRRYALTVNMNDVDLKILEPILEDQLSNMRVKGLLSGRVHLDGGLDQLMNVVADVNLKLHQFSFEDRTVDFLYKVDSLNLTGDRIALQGKNNTLNVRAALMHGGKLKATYRGGFDLDKGSNHLTAKLTGVPMQDFSPYTEAYMAYPIKEGTLAFESNSDILSGQLDSKNRMTIDQLKIGNKKRLSRAPYRNIPLKTGVALLQSAKGIIVLDLPVQGDIRSPKFNLKKIIGRVFLKVFFGPLMGVNDNRKLITDDEAAELQELLGEEEFPATEAVDSLAAGNDSTSIEE